MNARTAKVLPMRPQPEPPPAPERRGWPIRQQVKSTSCPADALVQMRAMSLLFGVPMKDGGAPPVLTHDQARDVVRWFASKETK